MLLDERANTVPGILAGSPVEEHRLRDTFGDPESSTTVVYHAKDKTPYRETLRGSLAGAAKEFEHLTHNEALSRIHPPQPDLNMAEVEVQRKEARERSGNQRLTRRIATSDVRARLKGRIQTGSIFDVSASSSCDTDWVRTLPSRFSEARFGVESIDVLQCDMAIGNVGDMPRDDGAAPYVPSGSTSTAVTKSSPLVASAILHTVSGQYSSSSRPSDLAFQHPCIHESDIDSGPGHNDHRLQVLRTAIVEEAESPAAKPPSTRKRGSSPIPTLETTVAGSLLGS